MICKPCREGRHPACRLCPCQHKASHPIVMPAPETQTEETTSD